MKPSSARPHVEKRLQSSSARAGADTSTPADASTETVTLDVDSIEVERVEVDSVEAVSSEDLRFAAASPLCGAGSGSSGGSAPAASVAGGTAPRMRCGIVLVPSAAVARTGLGDTSLAATLARRE